MLEEKKVAKGAEMKRLRTLVAERDEAAKARIEQQAEAKRAQKQMAKFGTRLSRHAELKAWNQWQGLCAERRRLQSFFRRLSSAGVGKAWNAWTELMYEQILKTISASSPGSNAKRRGFAISVAIKSTRWRHPRLGLLSEVYTMGPSWPVASPRF